MIIDNTQGGEEGTAPVMAAAGASAGECSNMFQTRNANGADWQEEVYQKIKSMKEMYLAELNDLYQKVVSKVQQHDSHPQRLSNEQIEKFRLFKITLERIVLFLRINKQDIQSSHKEKLVAVEKHICFFLSSSRPPNKPSSSPPQGQLPQSSMQLQQPQSLYGQTMEAMPQNNIWSFSSQSGTSPVQANLGSLQQNSSVLQQMSQSQQMLQNQQQQMQQLLFQRQQLMQLQQMGMKTGVLHQQQSFGQHVEFNHPQLKSGIFSPQLHQALSPQVTQHLSPQIDQQNMLASLSKAGTPLQSASSPFVVPSASTSLAPSPMPRASEKVSAGLASHTTAGNIMHQQATLPMEFEPYTSTVEAPIDSSAQTGNANGADWQEEVYQKIKSLREMHLSELNDLYWKLASKVQKIPQHEQIEKLKMFKMTLERIVLFLWLNKHEIQLVHKEKLFLVEKHIRFFLSDKRPHKPTSSPLQGQLPQPSVHTSQAQNTYAAHQLPTMDSDGQDIASEFERLLSLID